MNRKSQMVTAVIPLENDRPATFGWLQVEKKAVKELQDLAIKSPTSMGTLMYLINRMSRSNALVVSQQAIATELGISRESVNKSIKYLSSHNFVQVIKAGGSSVYVVNSRVAWQGNRGERFAHFGAEVIAIEAEQTSEIDHLPPLKGVPRLQEGERYLVGNEPIDPPDQGELNLP